MRRRRDQQPTGAPERAAAPPRAAADGRPAEDAGDWWAENDWDGWTDHDEEVWEYQDWDDADVPGDRVVGAAADDDEAWESWSEEYQDGRAAVPRRRAGALATAARPGGPPPDEPYDLDDEELPERFPAKPRRWTGLVTVLVVLAVIAGGALYGVRWVRHRVDPPGPPGETVAVIVPKGFTTADIGDLLQQNGVIRDARLFRYYVRIKGAGGFEAGKYDLRRDSSFDEVLETLDEGPTVPDQIRLTVPEGLRLPQIADRIGTLPDRSAARFLEVARGGRVLSDFSPEGSTNLEGLVFPDTYSIGLSEDEESILTRMVGTFDQVAAEVGLDDAEAMVGVSPYEAAIVASLVEREARVPEDRAKIARVIYNRLKKGMLLQIDATVIYALGRDVDRVLFRDLEVDSKYNTYKYKGLPPTPIAAPGRASLEAALRPAEGDWLYYVVTGEDGSHSFGETLAEHRRNIALAEGRGLR